MRLGDVPVPLNYVNPNQVNVLIPRGLTPNTQHQIVVQRGATLSVPVQVTVAEVQPAIYTLNAQDTGQGWIEIAGTGTIAGPPGSADGARPARRNETISIICAGLGPVASDPPDGAPAPPDTLINTLATPSVTIGGVNAPVSFAGLAPGMVGAYRVDAAIPSEAPSGDTVPVVITLNEIDIECGNSGNRVSTCSHKRKDRTRAWRVSAKHPSRRIRQATRVFNAKSSRHSCRVRFELIFPSAEGRPLGIHFRAVLRAHSWSGLLFAVLFDMLAYFSGSRVV